MYFILVSQQRIMRPVPYGLAVQAMVFVSQKEAKVWNLRYTIATCMVYFSIYMYVDGLQVLSLNKLVQC